MRRIDNELVAVVRPAVGGHFGHAVQQAHPRLGRHQRQWMADEPVRNRVVVEIETDIDRLTRPDRLDPVGIEWVRR